MKIFNDLSTKIANHRQDITKAVTNVLDRSYFVLGHEVKTFEQSFAEYLNVNYCVSTGNGTDALELGLRALNIQKNDIVATVANAGFFTSTALLAIGAIPYYLDVSLETQLVTFDSVKQALQDGAKAVVITHLYGRCVPEIFEIKDLCHKNSVALIEDCAQAHGAKLKHQAIGSFGNVACFSFYPTKNLGALGDGGAIVCSSEEIAEKIKLLRHYGWKDKYRVMSRGARNSRLDEMQAAILNAFLPYLDQWNMRRREIAKQYSTNIKHPAIICPPPSSVSNENYVAHLYVVRCTERDALRKYLEEIHGIATGIHYPIPDHHQPILGDNFINKKLPNTERLANEILTLPCYPEMTDQNVQTIINAINQWPG